MEPVGGGLLPATTGQGLSAPYGGAGAGPAQREQRVIFRCWQNRTPYQEAIYEAALRKSGCPIVALFDKVELGKSPFKKWGQRNFLYCPACLAEASKRRQIPNSSVKSIGGASDTSL